MGSERKPMSVEQAIADLADCVRRIAATQPGARWMQSRCDDIIDSMLRRFADISDGGDS